VEKSHERNPERENCSLIFAQGLPLFDARGRGDGCLSGEGEGAGCIVREKVQGGSSN